MRIYIFAIHKDRAGTWSRTPYQILEMMRMRLVKIPDIILPLLETTKSLKF